MDATPENPDEEARKKAANPLTKYFGGQPKAPAAPQAVPQAPAAPAAQQAAPKTQAPQVPSTNVGAGSQATVQQLPPAPATLQQPAAQQAPTGFVNFQRYFSANKGASEHQAAQLGMRAQNAANDAAGKLAEAQRQFGAGVDQSTLVGPNGEPLTAEQMQQRSQQLYTGPGGLSDVAGAQAAADSAQAAQQQLGALGSAGGIQALQDQANPNGASSSAFSAGLVDAAGRANFDRLRGTFNPEQDVTKAGAAAQKQADEARAKSSAASKAWGDAATQKQADDAAKAKAAADKTAAPRPIPSYKDRNNPAAYISDPSQLSGEMETYGNFIRAQNKDAGDELRTGIRALSPVDHLWQEATHGKKSPFDQQGSDFNYSVHKGDDTYGKYGVGGGNMSGGKGEHIPWSADDYVVFRQMDPSQWAQLQSLGADGQRGWINKRRQELAPDWAKQQYQAGEHKDFF